MTKRILIVQKDYVAGGGVERVLDNLAAGIIDQAQQGADVEVLNFFIQKADSRPDIPSNRCFHGSGSGGLLAFLRAWFQLVALILKFRISHIIAAKEQANLLVLLSTLPCFWVRRIYSRHCAFDVSDQSLSPQKIGLLYRLYLLFGGTVVTVSEQLACQVKETALTAGGRQRVHYIPNPVFESYKVLAHAAEPLPAELQGVDFVVAVGRLCEQKGFDLLLEAWAQLANLRLKGQQPLPLLVILGDGPDRPALEQQAERLGITDRVRFAGYVENPYKYLVNARLFVLSSRPEGIPTVLVEALALGRPVVRTACPTGPNELLNGGEFGYLCPPEDINGLVYVINQGLTDPIRVPASIVQRYSIPNATACYLQVMGISRDQRPDITLVMHDLAGGGAEKMMARLANAIAEQGYRIEVVLMTGGGVNKQELSPAVELIELGASRTLAGVPRLMRYLRQTRPHAVISVLTHVNVAAIIAGALSGYPGKLFVSERNTLSKDKGVNPARLMRLTYWLAPKLYKLIPNPVLCVSEGVAGDLQQTYGLLPEQTRVLPNPVITKKLISDIQRSPSHHWLQNKVCPVVVAVGRLSYQKGFDLLIEAFSRLDNPSARLIIFGEGELRDALQQQIDIADLSERVSLPGYCDTPVAEIAAADLFVLSSRFEGSPNVLVEAMRCGVPVIATDCPSGPDQILRTGKLAPLIAVDDVEGLARAMNLMLSTPCDVEPLLERTRDYTDHLSATRYMEAVSAARVGL